MSVKSIGFQMESSDLHWFWWHQVGNGQFHTAHPTSCDKIVVLTPTRPCQLGMGTLPWWQSNTIAEEYWSRLFICKHKWIHASKHAYPHTTCTNKNNIIYIYYIIHVHIYIYTYTCQTTVQKQIRFQKTDATFKNLNWFAMAWRQWRNERLVGEVIWKLSRSAFSASKSGASLGIV